MLLRKTLSSLLFTCSVSFALLAQTEKGAFMVGTDFKLRDLDFSKRGDFKYMQYNAGFEIGYFFKNNWLLGGELGFGHTSNRNSNGLGYKAENFSTGLFASKYFNLKNPKWKPFVEVGFGYNKFNFQQKTSFTPVEFPSGSSSGGYGRLEVGIAYFLNQKLSLNLSGYSQINTHSEGYNTIGGIKFGVRYHFNGKKD